jgi:hypothetical protein
VDAIMAAGTTVKHLQRLATVTALVAAACSANPLSQDKLDSLSPQDAVKQAFDQISRESYKSEYDFKITYDTRQLPPDIAQRFSASASDAVGSAKEEVENVNRARVTLPPSRGSRKTVYLVVYDGTIYVSTDGTTYKEAPFMGSLVDQLIGSTTADFAQHVKDVKDGGQETDAGATVEHYKASVEPSYLNQLVKNLTAGNGIDPATAAAIASVMKVENAAYDVYVRRRDAQPTKIRGLVTASLDFAKLAASQGAPPGRVTGVLKVNSDATTKFHDYGAKIKLEKPNPTGTITPEELSRETAG